MGTVVSRAKQKLQGCTDDPDHLDNERPRHDHVGVGEDLDMNPRHPLPKGISWKTINYE